MTKEELKARIKEESRNDNRQEIERMQRVYLQTPTSEAKFGLAMLLVKSRSLDDVRRGVVLFNELILERVQQRDCLYFAAEGNYRLGEYVEAKNCITRLLEVDPECKQALELKILVDDEISKDGLIGMAIIGGLSVAGALVASAVIEGLGRHR
eukprot:EC122427.1.p1 GENE.EC122427.1~~EC122427.1.p1  ORF type:complete len:153 (+),score=14.06 EC122427.1:128-586(+)